MYKQITNDAHDQIRKNLLCNVFNLNWLFYQLLQQTNSDIIIGYTFSRALEFIFAQGLKDLPLYEKLIFSRKLFSLFMLLENSNKQVHALKIQLKTLKKY